MKGIILIVDGNYQLMKTVFPLQQANTLYGELFNVLQNSFEKQISLFPFKQIFYVSDSKNSWRKQVNETYKANRVKKEEIDWSFVFQCYSEFKEKVGDKKCVHLEYPGLEGDDWIASLVNKANRNGYSTLIISADQDLLQLLEWSLDPDYINIMYRDNVMMEKVWYPKGYNIFMNKLQKTPIDLFALDWRHDFFQLVKKFSKYNVNEINQHESLFRKIVSGDAGDNIQSALITYTKTGKPRGIGDAGAERIWNNYIQNGNDEIVDYENDDTIRHMTDLVLEYKKSDDTKREAVSGKIKENVKMIKLHNTQFVPPEYQNVLDASIDKVMLL